jgi:hypothetical protein
MSSAFPFDIDVGTTLKLPTRGEVAHGSRRLAGFYVSEDSGEGTFVPPKWFLSIDPLLQIDVLQDLIHDLEILRRRAILEYAQSFAESHPKVESADHLRAFRKVCESLGIHVPSNLEALLVLAETFKDHGKVGRRKS